MAVDTDRDLSKEQASLTQWLKGKLPSAENLVVSNLKVPGGSGFSNDTILCDLSYRVEAEEVAKRLAIRISPKADAFPVFPFYDIPRQFDVMKALGDNTDVPVPNCLWKEYDETVLGASFYVMEFVSGDVPSDNPSYPVEGFVKDASPAQREKMWWSGIDNLARIHRQDLHQAGLGFLAPPDQSRSPIEQHLQYYEDYFHWAAKGRNMPIAEATLDWLKANIPSDEPEGIVWGDARVGNQIFQDFEVSAVLDWEMVATGNPETDLAWWIFVDKITMKGNGNPEWARPRLEGLPSHEETVRYYEKITERKTQHLHFYEVFAGFRFTPIMMRLMQQMVRIGMFDADLGAVLERDNMVTQTLAELLDLPPPD